MILSRVVRRKRWTVYKLILVIFAVSGVVFWISQVWNAPLNASNIHGDPKGNRASLVFPKEPDNQNEFVNGAVKQNKHKYEKIENYLKYSEAKSKTVEDLNSRFNQIAAPDKLSDDNLSKLEKIVPPSFSDKIMKVTPGLGEKGVAVYLSPEEQKLADEEFNSAAFNVYLSDRISLNRSVPDPRHPLCKYERYDYDLPSASVIIIFTDESWSALLRTIHSVINRSPKHLLHEIILVDDFSDRDYLKVDLRKYIQEQLPAHLVQLIRLNERQGLIRARLAGAMKATGDVLIFLDSHCEANDRWLEPLVQRIKENRKAVLCPIIDVIDDKTLEYYASNKEYFQVGGFTWSGHFNWIEISPAEEKRRKSPISPTKSPTMAGGLFAIQRKYFWEIGSYDSGMDIWGGENLEISFRVWLCGGTLEFIPCSHVGHIFRSFHPYTFPGNKDTHGINTVRTVEVWLDDYKKYFYMFRHDLESVDYGDITERLALKKRLQCKPFSWFLQNVFTAKFIFDTNVTGYGKVRNPLSRLCLDILNRDESSSERLGIYFCHTQEAVVMNQMFSLSNDHELRREENCAEVTGDKAQLTLPVLMSKCHGKKGDQEWVHNMGGPIVHVATGKCLDTAKKASGEDAFVTDCNGGHSQIWWFEHYNDIDLDVRTKP